MANEIPNVWPEDITLDIVTPQAILRIQAENLRTQTKGLLHARVTRTESDREALYELDVIAPVLGSTHRVLNARHGKDVVYPVIVDAECFRREHKEADFQAIQTVLLGRKPRHPGAASTQDEFLKVIETVLGSNEVRSLLQSLIARSNEAQASEPTSIGEDQEPPTP